MELIGRNTFPPIGDLPYLMMLPAYGFFWFRLSTDALPPAWHDDKRPLDDLPTLVLFDTWSSFFRSRVVPWRMGLARGRRAPRCWRRPAPGCVAGARPSAGCR